MFALGSAARAQSVALTIGELALSAICGVLLIRRQAGHPAPMIPVDLFRIPMFALSVMTAVCSFATQGLAFVSLPFLLIGVLGRSQVETGFLITPWPVVVAIMAPIAGFLADRYRVGLLGGIGLAILSCGMALLATIPRDAGVFDIGWRLAMCGCGFGFFQSPNMKALLLSAPSSRAGGASGMVATARLTGQTIGAALAAFCFSIGNGNGPVLALTVGVAFAAVGSAASFIRLRYQQGWTGDDLALWFRRNGAASANDARRSGSADDARRLALDHDCALTSGGRDSDDAAGASSLARFLLDLREHGLDRHAGQVGGEVSLLLWIVGNALGGENGFLKRRRLDTHASLALLGCPFRAHWSPSSKFYSPDLGQVFRRTMNKVTQQRCHALCRAFAFVLVRLLGLAMHDWCHSSGICAATLS